MASRPLAIVTGATGAMGRCTVDDLSATHDVVALGRNQAALEELDRLDHVTARALDLADTDALAAVLEPLERIDVLVHVAAISVRLTVEEARPADWREHFETNVVAPAELTRLALPKLRESRGTVIFIGSGASRVPAAGHVVYTASKHALLGLADTLRIDEALSGVRVSTIAPGPTNSGMLRENREQAGADYEPDHYLRPESIAQAVRYVVDAPPDAQITDVLVRPRVELHLRRDEPESQPRRSA
ncbi:SDR family oxidoreductase [Tessaracoccus sp. OS52]|uniref:SDR family oxidoreductase n=1 Tax=Tessaracoccus sp. OS52 TaxID=2886691 RepID=UPI001D107BAA|nr:SDR family oxidoreductase [Tessaracoccus sp. OS52]MCC2593636.1 SDR family oxidoreductase [Tessaracoccus sp. OS52]